MLDQNDYKNIVDQLIVNRSETMNFDIKEYIDPTNNDELMPLIKDILAMSNTNGGGKIIIGIIDGTFEIKGLSNEISSKFDITDLNNKLHKYTDPQFSVTLTHIDYEGRKLVMVNIPEFSEIPIICKKAYNNSSNELILKRGALYIRTESATSVEVNDSSLMRKVVSMGMSKKKDELLFMIKNIMEGESVNDEEKQKKLQNDMSNYEKYISKAKELLDTTGIKQFLDKGYIDFYAHPVKYDNEYIGIEQAEKALLDARYEGVLGYFPEMIRGNEKLFQDGIQNIKVTEYKSDNSFFQFFINGLFYSREYYIEDLQPRESDMPPDLNFSRFIFMITSYFQFTKQLYYDELRYDNDLKVCITLNKTSGRELSSRDWKYVWNSGKICLSPSIVIGTIVKKSDLDLSYTLVAKDFIRKTFFYFTGGSMPEIGNIIDKWQVKFENNDLN